MVADKKVPVYMLLLKATVGHQKLFSHFINTKNAMSVSTLGVIYLFLKKTTKGIYVPFNLEIHLLAMRMNLLKCK